MIKSNENYGVFIDGLEIEGKPAPYGVVNENAIRASAGLMFALAFFTMIYTYLTKDFLVVKIVVPLFFISFFLLVFVGPNASPFAIIGNWLSSWRPPEYVGAVQKRFAWMIGLVMATIMMFVIFILNVRGMLPLSICGLCVLFMWLEFSVGFCVGCKIYAFLRDKKLIKEPEFAPVCAGGACSIKSEPTTTMSLEELLSKKQ